MSAASKASQQQVKMSPASKACQLQVKHVSLCQLVVKHVSTRVILKCKFLVLKYFENRALIT